MRNKACKKKSQQNLEMQIFPTKGSFKIKRPYDPWLNL